ncbi:MAG: MATE family efflux transporter, partial [Pacificimonas sp.]
MTASAAPTVPEDLPRSRLKALVTLAWPVVLSRLGIMIMGVTDAVVVGRYSAEELAFQGLGWAPTMVVLTTGIGLLYGVQVVTAQFVGEGRREEAGAVLQRGVLLALGTGLVATAALYFGAGPVMRAMQLEGDLGPESAAVVRVLALSMPLYLMGVACAFWLEALERPVPAMLVMAAVNIVNLILNLWLVPGNSPFPVDGAVASAWTTLFSRGAYAVGLILIIVKWREAHGLGVFMWRTARRWHSYWGRLMKVGAATAVSYFVETAGFAGMNIIAGWIGGLAVAAFAIIFNILGLVFMLPLGIAGATAVLVGKAHGERDRTGVRTAGLLGLGVAFALLVVISLVVVLGRDLMSMAYT